MTANIIALNEACNAINFNIDYDSCMAVKKKTFLKHIQHMNQWNKW